MAFQDKIEMGNMGGQEQEKEEITRIKQMAEEISQMCDSLMQRENEEDKEEGVEGEEVEDGSGMMAKESAMAPQERLKIILKNGKK